MHPNEALVRRLYDRLAARDGIGMTECYAPDATFVDPVFGELRGAEIGAMWRMLTARARSIDTRLVDVQADDQQGRTVCHASYPYGRGRIVNNVLRTRFWFADGLIVRQEDRFSLWRWSRMALGPVGFCLGWSPPVRHRIRAGARRGLDDFMLKETSPSATP